MLKKSIFHHANLSPWQAPLQDNEQYTNSRQQSSSSKRDTSLSHRQSKSQNKPRISRTAVKVTKINISNDKIVSPVSQKHATVSLTPKSTRTLSYEKPGRRDSTDWQRRNSVMTLETWRNQSKRVLNRMMLRSQKDCKPQERVGKGRQSEEEWGVRMLEKYLKESDLGREMFVYKKPKSQHPNFTRFKLIQIQKKARHC